jgi:hypothetical protein
MAGKVVAVSISKGKGERKTPVAEVELRENHGVVGDGHAGEWHRQVSLLAMESIAKMQQLGLAVDSEILPRMLPRKGSICRHCRSVQGSRWAKRSWK